MASANKMNVSNLAMIFSGVLFQNQLDQQPEPSPAVGWFSKPNPMADMLALEFLKSDLVIEDLLTHSAYIFGFARTTSRGQISPSPIDSTPPTLPSRSKSQLDPLASPSQLDLHGDSIDGISVFDEFLATPLGSDPSSLYKSSENVVEADPSSMHKSFENIVEGSLHKNSAKIFL